MPGSLTPTLVAGLARLGTWMPFGRAAQLLGEFWQVPVSAATARRRTEATGAAYVEVQASEVEALEREQREGDGGPPSAGSRSPEVPAGPPVQQLSVDGAFVPLLGGLWGEVKLLTLGTVGAPVWEDGEWRVHAGDLSYFGRMTDHQTFGRLAQVELHRRGTERAGRVAAVMDGAEWQQGFVDLHRPDATRILDFPHAAEYVAKIGQAAFGTGTATTAAWLTDQLHQLKHGQDTTVLSTLTELCQRVAAASSAEVRKDLETRLAYLEKRRDQIHYGKFRESGYPIGSGAVESGNKLVTEARLKGAGMHWAPEHVDPLVALRTAVCADRWEESWSASSAQLREQAHQRTRARGAARDQRQASLTALVPATMPAGPASPPEAEASVVGSAPEPSPASSAPEPSPASPASVALPASPAPPTPASAPSTKVTTPQPRRPAANHPWRRLAVGRRAAAPFTN